MTKDQLNELWKLLQVAQRAAAKLNTMYIRGECSRRYELDELIGTVDRIRAAQAVLKEACRATHEPDAPPPL